MTAGLVTLTARLHNASVLVRLMLAFLFGASATLAMPPTHLWPVLWMALPAFLVLSETFETRRSTFLFGWTFGFGYFSTGFAWIGNAFFVDSDTFGALAVPAIGGLAAGFALYIGFVALALKLLPAPKADAWPRAKTAYAIAKVFLFAAAWALIEWWRGWFLTGLPWNPVGSVWVTVPPVLQGASLFGVYGLSLITVLGAGALALLVQGKELTTVRRTVWIVALAFQAPLLFVSGWGLYRLGDAETGTVPGVTLRLVQPNIAQADKWRPGMREAHVREQVRMSTANADAVTHVLWAETAVPFPLNQAAGARALTAQAAPQNGFVLTGAARIEEVNGERRAYNSLFAIGKDGAITTTYDKFHLVPFGEYMPLRDLIPIPQLTGGTGFTPGHGPVTLTLPGLPSFSPLICYEIIFPAAVADPTSRPAWLFNLTNDAWFGISSGPYQHLATAQMRAVEEGLPVLRVANTGISAAINGYGRIISQIGLGEKGYLDTALPVDLPPTLFSRAGHWPFLLVSLGLAGISVLIVRRIETIT